ncbi:MAG: hypothetical protein CM1200mP35_10470 [Chloroflexota bacterium]|nr:MAG: hypothetical protein CM1200mP35_10470 [Chloroflexota bacterium]
MGNTPANYQGILFEPNRTAILSIRYVCEEHAPKYGPSSWRLDTEGVEPPGQNPKGAKAPAKKMGSCGKPLTKIKWNFPSAKNSNTVPILAIANGMLEKKSILAFSQQNR